MTAAQRKYVPHLTLSSPAFILAAALGNVALYEYGLYLHGTPYSIAPDVQEDIPFTVWTSGRSIAPAQLAAGAAHSQQNVFQSVMGALGVRSEIYNPALDLFASP